MQWLASPSGKRGRSSTFLDAAIQFCLTIKCLFGSPLRQALGLVQSLLKLMRLLWSAPDYSTVCRRQHRLDVQVHYRPSVKGLHMLADSTSIKFLGEGEWKTKKHGAERRRQWRKAHLGIDAETLQILAIVVTTRDVGESPVGTELLDQIPAMKKWPASRVMERMTPRMGMRLATGVESSLSSRRVKEQGCAKGWHSPIAMKPSRHASDWAGLSGNAGVAATEGHWWRRR